MINISDKKTNFLVIFLLALMFFLAVFSVKDDSATMDELARIPAGYSYLTQRDFRLHFEDPPLVKDISAIPLLFLNLKFPKEHSSWTKDVNGEWVFGSEFLYRSNNNADQILFWARLPMIFILLFLGWFIFKWTRELAGNLPALLVLFLFSFSPDFLAHGRLVTTDVPAALGIVLSIYFYLKFLETPNRKNIILSGLILGTTLLIKFSTTLLFPFFAILTLFFVWLSSKILKSYIKGIILIILISTFVIFIVYQFHILNFPLEKQLEAMKAYLSFDGVDSIEEIAFKMAEIPILRPLSHYLFGFLVTIQREMKYGHYSPVGGTFLFGMLGFHFWYYFPFVFLIKIPLAFLLLTLFSFLSFFYFLEFTSLKSWIKNHFIQFSMLLFIIIYSLLALRGKVNIGLRHFYPVYPFLFILVSICIKNWYDKIKELKHKKLFIVLVSFLLIWYGTSSLSSFPHYLSYFNELVGGSKRGYEYVVDSNVDWGQDLKRLSQWVESQGIDKIYVDYFGGGDLNYYFGDKAIPWYGACWWRQWGWNLNKQDFPKGNYLAVSATYLQDGRGKPVIGFDGYWGCYDWLNDYKSVDQVGDSIIVYYID